MRLFRVSVVGIHAILIAIRVPFYVSLQLAEVEAEFVRFEENRTDLRLPMRRSDSEPCPDQSDTGYDCQHHPEDGHTGSGVTAPPQKPRLPSQSSPGMWYVTVPPRCELFQ